MYIRAIKSLSEYCSIAQSGVLYVYSKYCLVFRVLSHILLFARVIPHVLGKYLNVLGKYLTLQLRLSRKNITERAFERTVRFIKTHTSPISVAVSIDVRFRVCSSELVQTEIGDFQDESRIDHAVRRLEITVTLDFRCVEINHAADDIVYQGSPEHAIEF